MLEGLIFILVGLDLPVVLRTVEGRALSTLIRYGLVISVTVIVVRIAWTFPAAYIRQAIEQWRGRTTVVVNARERHRHRVHRYASRQRHRVHRRDESAAADYRKVRREMIDAERREMIRLRDDVSER